MWWMMVLVACKGQGDAMEFHADVAPVLDQHCMQCHDAGGIAPMSFDTYENTKPWAEAIVAATQSRRMPPKQVTQDGTCGDFVDPWWLSESELSVLAKWAEADAPEGTPKDRTPSASLPSITPTHTVTTPDFVPEIVGGPAAEFDEYRCFPVPLDNLTEDKFLTGYDVHPGNKAIVHHVIGVIVDPAANSDQEGLTNAQQMQALDDESPDRLGWPCFSGAGSRVNYESDPIAWAPGQGAVSYPEGTGIRVPAGAVFVAQVHYNLADASTIGQSDSTEVELKLEDDVEKEIFPLYLDFLLQFGDSIPAGESAYEYSNTLRTADIGVPFDINIIGIMPHMHGRGVKLDFSVSKGQEESCLIDVNDWDYGWQFLYFYDRPFRVAPQDVVKLSCTFDTSDATAPVTAGWGTQNEMCLAVVYATL